MLFAKFYSPQWILWVSPLLILLIKNKKAIISLIAFDVVTYLYFPIFYDVFSENSILFTMIIILKTAIILILIWPLLKELIKDNRFYIQSSS